MIVKVKSIPANTGIITKTEAKEQLGIPPTFTGTDIKINSWLLAASGHISRGKTGRYIIQQSLECVFDSWKEVEGVLPYGYFQSVTSLKYLDKNGDSKTVDSSLYHVLGVATDEGRVKLDDLFSYPELFDHEPITLEIVIGYPMVPGEDGNPDDYQANIPEELKAACKLYVEQLADAVDLDKVINLLCGPFKSWNMGLG